MPARWSLVAAPGALMSVWSWRVQANPCPHELPADAANPNSTTAGPNFLIDAWLEASAEFA